MGVGGGGGGGERGGGGGGGGGRRKQWWTVCLQHWEIAKTTKRRFETTKKAVDSVCAAAKDRSEK